ncbi:DUF881 domain-containing protein [Aeromicrobium alkaliterrae]|uniref:DUF881 domain-containing protein n=1 Tax=Aeromicrobium alkaliterrae TaxID=302168 RepID=A0ABN2JDL4_9ACTN
MARSVRPGAWRVGALCVSVVAGYAFVSSAVTSRGSDLRPAGGDIATLLQDRAREVELKRSSASSLEEQIAGLSAAVGAPELDQLLASGDLAATQAGVTEVEGSGLRITLTDAPRTADASATDPNQLVVHQQDIQGFVNAMWAGGARAVTLQGQRLVSTSGIKCVGSTVVVDGVPYSPPYVIEAIGTTSRLQNALDESSQVEVYREYVRKFGLGLQTEVDGTITAPTYTGQVDLRHATVPSPS